MKAWCWIRFRKKLASCSFPSLSFLPEGLFLVENLCSWDETKVSEFSALPFGNKQAAIFPRRLSLTRDRQHLPPSYGNNTWRGKRELRSLLVMFISKLTHSLLLSFEFGFFLLNIPVRIESYFHSFFFKICYWLDEKVSLVAAVKSRRSKIKRKSFPGFCISCSGQPQSEFKRYS